MIAFFILAALAQSSASMDLPKVAPQVVREMQAYGRCLDAKAIALEPSEASPDDVFRAAQTACASNHTDALHALIDDIGKSQTKAEAARVSLSMLDASDANSQNAIRLKILELRAQRKK